MTPWRPSDAPKHTKKANTPKKKRQFAQVANSVLAKTGDEGRAIREANAVVGRKRKNSKIVTSTSGYDWRNR
jgi:hypothetical protein